MLKQRSVLRSLAHESMDFTWWSSNCRLLCVVLVSILVPIITSLIPSLLKQGRLSIDCYRNLPACNLACSHSAFCFHCPLWRLDPWTKCRHCSGSDNKSRSRYSERDKHHNYWSGTCVDRLCKQSVFQYAGDFYYFNAISFSVITGKHERKSVSVPLLQLLCVRQLNCTRPPNNAWK